jgi:excisionase family DNA binding protein
MSELPAEKLGYSPTEAMNAIPCSKGTLYKLIREGRLDARRLGEQRTIITKQSLQALIDNAPRANKSNCAQNLPSVRAKEAAE